MGFCTVLCHVFGDAGFLRTVFSNKGEERTAYQRFILGASDFVVLGSIAFLLFRVFPYSWLPFLCASISPLICFTYAAQIRVNFQTKSTGELAVLTVFLRWLASLIRVLTTWVQLAGDPVVLINHALGALGCSILLFQLYWYNPARVAPTNPLQKFFLRKKHYEMKTALVLWRSLGGFRNEKFSRWQEPAIEELRIAFDKIDSDRSGKISRDELEVAFKAAFGEQKDFNRACKLMFKAADADKDGCIGFSDFCQMFRAI